MSSASGPAPTIDAAPFVDEDLDGLDDAYELDIATRYMPFIALDPGDGCTRSGLVVRVRPHPQADGALPLRVLAPLPQGTPISRRIELDASDVPCAGGCARSSHHRRKRCCWSSSTTGEPIIGVRSR